MSAPHEDGMAPQPPDGEAERSTETGTGTGTGTGSTGKSAGSSAAGDQPARSTRPEDRWDLEFSDDGLGEIGAALRDRLHQAVAGLEPGPGTLDYLRRAVPARRRRRNTALAATAVSVFAVSAGATLAARGSFDPGPAQAGGSNVGNLLTTATNDAPGGGSGHGPAVSGGKDMSSDGAAVTATSSAPASAPGHSKPTQSPSVTSLAPSGSALAAACQNSSLSSVVATQTAVADGVTYETFLGTVKSACSLSGLPALAVTGAGGVPADVSVYKADQSVAPLLPAVPVGQTLALRAGDRFEFQLAWVPLPCPTNPPSSSGPTSAPSSSMSPTVTASSSGPTPSGPSSPPSSQPTPTGTPSSSAPDSKAYSVGYAVSGSQAAQSASFTANCAAAVYVTDYFQPPEQRHAAHPTTASSTR